MSYFLIHCCTNHASLSKISQQLSIADGCFITLLKVCLIVRFSFVPIRPQRSAELRLCFHFYSCFANRSNYSSQMVKILNTLFDQVCHIVGFTSEQSQRLLECRNFYQLFTSEREWQKLGQAQRCFFKHVIHIAFLPVIKFIFNVNKS